MLTTHIHHEDGIELTFTGTPSSSPGILNSHFLREAAQCPLPRSQLYLLEGSTL